MSLVFPEPTVRTGRFGADVHWIRARIDGEVFEPATASDSTGDPTALPIEILGIDPRNGRVVLVNTGGTPVDLGGYRIEFECAGPDDRTRTFPSEYVVAPHGTRTVSTGTEGADPFEFEHPPLDERVRNAVTVRSQGGQTVTRRVEGEPEPCERWLETVPPAGEPDRSPPVVLGLYPNTGWAYNVETVDGELLGSSDGTAGQSFAVASPPVTDEVLRVNELAALSEGERAQLLRTDPDRVEESTGPGGEPVAFWVEWTRVEDFRASGAEDRHYRLDPTAGRFTFGDGRRGRIPPRGADNVMIDYRTGGGAAGNVRAGAVTDLVSTIPFVDGVVNPEPGDAGADAETVDAVVERAPKELRDRNRAVSGGDFERLAMAASRKLARVRCIPSMDDAGEYSPGWVTLLVVPDEARPKPVPSVELKDRVAASVSEHAPATLVAHGGTRPEGSDARVPELVVRGPSYVEVSVATTLRAGEVGSVSALEAAVVRALDAFLHPLTGGEAGDGWAFGELPCLSDLYALLEGVDGVDHVVDLELTFRGADESETVSEGEENPNVAADVLAFGGTHAVAIDGTTGAATARSTTWD